jgi:S1-C subfamily serine protease
MAASGIIWPESGVVVTADHAVERDDDVGVTLADGQKLSASVVGRDPGSDLAVLRLAGQAPAAAQLAPADSARVGHLVLALGRPGQGALMASFGVVSALGGSWRTARGGIVEGYIRADVRLYPGFSGGPLVDTHGRVVGLNSWYLARGQELAIPAHTVSSTVQTLLTQGRIRRGYLGLTSQPVRLPQALREKLSLEQDTGLMVVGVEAGSPAEQGGLGLGDVLVAVAERRIADVEDLQMALGAGVVDKATAVTVIRGGERTQLSVTPTERR